MRITLNGGPLNGRTFDVPSHAARVEHHAIEGGWYDLEGTWHPDAAPGASVDGVGLEEFLPKGLPRVVAEARMGRRVLLVGHTVRAAREAFDEVLGLAYDRALDDMSVTRANGNARARFESGGVILPLSPRSRHARGLSADVIYLLPEVDRLDVTDLLPALADSKVGLLLDAHGEVA